MIEVTIAAGLFIPNTHEVRVNQKHGLVYMYVDGRVMTMKTPVAHKTGFAMVKQSGEALDHEHIIVNIDGEKLNFHNESAKKIGGSLLRKADAADDFQKRLN